MFVDALYEKAFPEQQLQKRLYADVAFMWNIVYKQIRSQLLPE